MLMKHQSTTGIHLHPISTATITAPASPDKPAAHGRGNTQRLLTSACPRRGWGLAAPRLVVACAQHQVPAFLPVTYTDLSAGMAIALCPLSLQKALNHRERLGYSCYSPAAAHAWRWFPGCGDCGTSRESILRLIHNAVCVENDRA